MAKVDANNAFMAGSERDTLYLGPIGTDLSSVTALDSPIPAALQDVGWLDEDGLTLGMSDSVDKIRGHQGHGVVRTYMSDSSTTFTANLIESKLAQVKAYLGVTKTEKVTAGSGSITRMEVSTSRKVESMCGIADLFDVSTGKQRRYVFKRIELGERSDIQFKVGELTVYECSFEVLDGYVLLTDEAGLAVA